MIVSAKVLLFYYKCYYFCISNTFFEMKPFGFFSGITIREAITMQCPKCGSTNVLTQVVTHTDVKNRGCLGWLLWIFLATITLGLILIIPLVTNTKTKQKSHTEAVCQNCGKHWRV